MAARESLKEAILLPWKGAQGDHEGRPFLMRFRDIPPELRNDSGCDHLLVATYTYPVDHQSGLPSPAQYKAIAEFEERFIDTLEKAGLAILVLTRTGGGELEYFVYGTKPTDELLAFLGENVRDEDPVTFSEDEDPEWTQYKSMRSMISG